MTNQEYYRLKQFETARKRAFKPSRKIVTKRSTKNQKRGIGMILRNSRVEYQAPLVNDSRWPSPVPRNNPSDIPALLRQIVA